jgi:biotin operon repressor
MTKKGDLEISDKILGNFIVSDTEWDQCGSCGEILYSPITMRDIEKTEEQIKTELLLKKSLKEFILGPEVAEILGCSRQAIHKHKRIRRGFIHFVKHNSKIYYLKQSVEQYKETGDGRIQLSAPRRIQASNVINFKEHLRKKREGIKTGCFIDAGSDSPCLTEAKNPQKNILEESMEG